VTSKGSNQRDETIPTGFDIPPHVTNTFYIDTPSCVSRIVALPPRSLSIKYARKPGFRLHDTPTPAKCRQLQRDESSILDWCVTSIELIRFLSEIHTNPTGANSENDASTG